MRLNTQHSIVLLFVYNSCHCNYFDVYFGNFNKKKEREGKKRDGLEKAFLGYSSGRSSFSTMVFTRNLNMAKWLRFR